MKTKILDCLLAMALIAAAGCDKYESPELYGQIPLEQAAMTSQKPAHQRDWLERGDTLRLLALGNSYARDALMQNLHEMLQADTIASEISVLHISSCTLQEHFGNLQAHAAVYRYYSIDTEGQKEDAQSVSANDALLQKKWTYISLQQSSGLSGKLQSYEETLPGLMGFIRGLAGEEPYFVLHQTWAYPQGSQTGMFELYDNSMEAMYHAIVYSTSLAYSNYDFALIAPSGTAIQNARSTSIGPDLTRDGLHLEIPLGQYIAACAWYCALTGRDCRGNAYNHPDIDDASEALAREAAYMAYLHPFEVTIGKE